MARKPKFTQQELSYTCSQIRRNIINKIKKGSINKISKTQALDMIAHRLNLATSRTLWSGTTGEYIDIWFQKVSAEVTDILDSFNNNNKNDIVNIHQTHEQTIDTSDDIDTLRAKLDAALSLIKSQDEAIKQLRIENEDLRIKLIEKHGKIDL